MRSQVLGIALFACIAASAHAQSTITFATLNEEVLENAGTLQLTVLRSGSLDGSASVDYVTYGTSATEGEDFIAANGTLTFGDQESMKSIALSLINDADPDPIDPRTIEVHLQDPVNATIGAKPSHFVYIHDDEAPLPPLELQFSDLTWPEGDGVATVSITVSLNRAASQTVTAAFRPLTPPGLPTDQYNGARVRILSSVMFAPGETTKQVPMEITGNDTYDGGAAKGFPFTVMPGPGGVGGDFFVMLTEDDPQPTVSISDVSVVEGSCGPTVIELTLTASHLANGIVQWAASDGTATNADIDYGPYGVPQPARFRNTNTATLTLLAAYGDLQIEPDETFYVDLTGATNMIIDRSRAAVTIENDDFELARFAHDRVNVTPGTDTELTIDFPAPAPKGTVSLQSSDPNIHVPLSVDVPERATSVTFTADTKNATGSATVTARLANSLGGADLHVMVDVAAWQLRFMEPRRSAFAGETATATLSITPPRDEAVRATLAASAGIVVPRSVIVPAGGSVTFAYTMLSAGTGWIRATFDSSEDSFAIEVAAPTLASLSPDLASTAGGSAITLKGLGFSNGCSAMFGNVEAATTFIDGETLVAIAPAHAAEVVDVTVTCGATPVVATDAFRFASPRRRASRH
ncbi:MAG TPA: Calx-beta domain-containing protein [Thermoanaerobaculia bacterium]